MPIAPQITNTPIDLIYFEVTAVSYTSSTATYTATGHTYAIGDSVAVSGLSPDGYNGTFTVTGVATNTFTVANTTNASVTVATGDSYGQASDSTFDASYIPLVYMTDTEDLADPNVNPALATAQAAQADATTALANASTAYSAAIGSLQPSASTIVNASNQMTAISTNGITVYSGSSSSSGARVVMNSTGIAGFDTGGSATFSISASTGAAVFSGSVTGSTITGGTLNIGGNAIINSSGYLTATGATITGNITATSGSFTGSLYSSTGTIAGWTINSNSIYSGTGAFMRSDTGNIGGNTVTAFSDILSYGIIQTTSGAAIEAAGYVRANGELYAAGHQTTSSAANGFVVTTGGRIARSTASSQRYKEDIVDLVSIDELNPKKLLDLPVRAFRYKVDHLRAGDDRFGMLIPGFIAEEVDAIYPIAADYLDGPESWNDRIMVPALLSLIQDLYKEVALLKGE